MHQITRYAVLILILVIAALLRFYALGSVPASMNADEAAIGYNAYSVLKTGRDEYGRKFPLLFQSFDDYKLPLYEYISIPGIAIFGLNDFSVRLPSAVLGTLTVAATYFLVVTLFSNIPVALISALLLAISPWHLQFSRSAYEANIAVFFVVSGFTLLLRAHKKQSLYILAFIFLGLSVWSYHTERIFVPLLGVGYIILYWKNIVKNMPVFLTGLILFILICLPLARLSFSATGLVRARGVSALDDPALTARNVSWRLTDIQDRIPLSNLYHNQRLVNGYIILKGYLEHFNPNFYISEIVQGKYHAPGVGLLYIWELPVLIYGLHKVGEQKGKEKYLLFLWLLLSPLAAAPTQMLPHPVRTLIFLPVIQIFTAFGLWEIVSRRKLFAVAATIIIILNGLYYLHQYYIHMPVDYAVDWQYGHKQVVESVKRLKDKYRTVVVSTTLDEPYIFFLYYLAYDPVMYQSEGGTKSGKFDEQRNAFDIYQFHTYMNMKTAVSPNTLYVGTPAEVPPEAHALQTISYPDGTQAYVISATD